MTVENISWSNLHERMLPTRQGSNPQLPDHQSDVHPTEPNVFLCSSSFLISAQKDGYTLDESKNQYYCTLGINEFITFEQDRILQFWFYSQKVQFCHSKYVLKYGTLILLLYYNYSRSPDNYSDTPYHTNLDDQVVYLNSLLNVNKIWSGSTVCSVQIVWVKMVVSHPQISIIITSLRLEARWDYNFHHYDTSLWCIKYSAGTGWSGSTVCLVCPNFLG